MKIKAITITALAAAAAIGLAGCRQGSHPAASAAPAPSPAASSPEAAATHASPAARASGSGRQSPASRCSAALWRHVYHAYRLHVVDACRTVSGTVVDVRREPDGDLHINVRPRHQNLVNAANVSYEDGDLVVEAICVGTVTQADAVDACRGFSWPVAIPAAGDRVTVTGSYVLDADHGWMEIHPVTRIRVTGHAPVVPAPSSAPPAYSAAPPPTHSASSAGCYPKTSSGNCYEPGEFCPQADAGEHGIAGDGKAITCEEDNGLRWVA